MPGADVRAQRRYSQDIAAGTTDSAGVVAFRDLLTGVYDLSALRVLTPEERGLLPSGLADVTGFAGAATVQLGAPQTPVMLPLFTGRRGGVVISEVYFSAPQIGDNIYSTATYIELYNNGDTTLYLDGKLVGAGPYWFWDFGDTQKGFFPCSLTTQWQNDPDGLWSPDLLRLPGGGRDYPLAPGEAAVIATDAVDHSAIDPRLPNLASASFESVGSADVDNPSVPNAAIIVQEFSSFLGRGVTFISPLGGIFFVADTVDLTAVPWMRPGSYNNQIPQIPRARVLDVFTYKATPEQLVSVGGDRYCQPFINEAFEREPGRFFDGHGFYGIARRKIGTANGRPLLLRTKTSSRDFERVDSLTPGWVR